jgi:hypothetical protein
MSNYVLLQVDPVGIQPVPVGGMSSTKFTFMTQ